MKSNLPIALTLLRVFLAIPVCFLIYLNTNWSAWLAFILFSFAGFSDFLDGYLARRMGSVSDLGIILDPIADKLFVCAVFVLLVSVDRLNHWNVFAVVIILSREILVSGLREFLGEKSIAIPVTNLAKWKTTTQILAQGTLILAPVLPASDSLC